MNTISSNSNSSSIPKSKSKWAIPIYMGDIAEQEGSETTLSSSGLIEIPLIGDYTAPNVSELNKAVQKIEDFGVKNNLPFSQENKKGPGSYARTAAGLFVESCPNINPDSPKMEVMNFLAFGVLYNDDCVEKIGKSSESIADVKKGLECFKAIHSKIWSGYYDRIEEIINDKDYSEKYSHFYPTFQIFHHAYRLAQTCVPKFSEEVEWFCLGYDKWVEAEYILTFLPNYSTKISLDSYFHLRTDDVGFAALVEFVLLVTQVMPEPKVRKHMLFELIKTLMGGLVGISNDIITLGKDILENNEQNYVRLLAKKNGTSLMDAVKKVIDVIEDKVRDIELAGQQLIEEFEQNPKVIKLFETMKDACNGCITYYQHTSRYGKNLDRAGTPIQRTQ